ncbi:Acin1, RNSP1-SAP18 binding (RSB) motif [Dillenia turbinata]|uniref:Acin1, RNSP1-SAP18 binding (RSB) motif n=1 Tax=Dillenia turbinata TaxID=194707 RepID=A0AAN8V083_9MAGN
MSSPYPVLDNRPIDQWKVTELKEELKRRKLTTKGLKEDLVKRLSEAVYNEREAAQKANDNGLDCVSAPEVQSQDAVLGPNVPQSVKETLDHKDIGNVVVDSLVPGDTDNDMAVPEQGKIQEAELGVGIDVGMKDEEAAVHASPVTTTTVDNWGIDSKAPSSEKETKFSEAQKENGDSMPQLETKDSIPVHEDILPDLSDPKNQVSEVSHALGFQVRSDYISSDSLSINEKNELKDNIIADHVKIELEVVKPEMVQPSSSNVMPDDGRSRLLDDEEPHEEKVSVDDMDGKVDISKENDNAELDEKNGIADMDPEKRNDITDMGSSEKLNLDRSSGDDSMEEDTMESKQIDSKFNPNEAVDRRDQIEIPDLKKEEIVDIVTDDLSSEKKDVQVENKTMVAASTEKRKFNDQEAGGNNEPLKRQRRWNTDSLKVPEPQGSNVPNSTTPKGAFQSPSLKRNFSRSDSTLSDDTPKERVVPPSLKSPTNSLRIDRFLRPFTLKAVQELLNKTGAVTSFWMDHIKTHCYVTYSSVEEATETRNAVYNLQWPPNGGRLLVAEFVDPQEVKMKVECPPQAPAAPPSGAAVAPPGPATLQLQAQPLPQPSPRQQNLRQHLPPPPLPPPPPVGNPPPVRERLHLPPAPPGPEKVDPPIVTLDDLFRKTKATPRIYYLPLSEEQVKAKLAARGDNIKL